MRIEQTIDIAAPPEVVWAVMTDVERWPEWTKSVVSLKRLDGGEFRLGSAVRIRQPAFPPTTLRVTAFDPRREFTWESHGPGAHAVAGHRIEATDAGCRVTLSAELSGWLVRLFARRIETVSREYVDMEARGLKARCEARAAGR